MTRIGDPDPYQNVLDPEHGQVRTGTCCVTCNRFVVSILFRLTWTFLSLSVCYLSLQPYRCWAACWASWWRSHWSWPSCPIAPPSPPSPPPAAPPPSPAQPAASSPTSSNTDAIRVCIHTGIRFSSLEKLILLRTDSKTSISTFLQMLFPKSLGVSRIFSERLILFEKD